MKFCQQCHTNCVWSSQDCFHSMLDRAGVPRDTKWRSLIIYLRGIAEFPHLTNQQKTRAQQLVTEALTQKDFSDARFARILGEYHASITDSYKKTIDAMVREASAVVRGFQDILLSRYGDLEQLEETTIQTVEEIIDGVAIVQQLHQAFGKVKRVMEKDLNTMKDMALRDGLTGMFNRRSFDNFMETEVARWMEERQPLALALFDVDHFKAFNDRHGHRIGDQVLTVVAAHIQRALDHIDQFENRILAARYGGEEFAVVISGPAAADIATVAETIRNTVYGYNFLIRDTDGNVLERGLRIALSGGVAHIWHGWIGSHAANLVESADKALYFSKREGRNRCAIFEPGADQPCRIITGPPRALQL